MLQNYNKYRVLQAFFDHPTKEWHLREIARTLNLATPSTKTYLNELAKESLIQRSEKGLYPTYKANRENNTFKRMKRLNTIHTLYESGFVDHVTEHAQPDAIILFGSASNGEDTEQSDIDICIISQETPLNLKPHEKKACRTINLFFAPDFNQLSKELKNNILNGTTLYGYIQVF